MSEIVKKKWEKALPSEVGFWKGLFENNSYNPGFVKAFMTRIETEPKFVFEEFADEPTGATIKVLDVGAGPLTHVGRVSEKYRVEVTAIDPLADEYSKLWREFEREPRIKTIFGEAERISEMFAPKEFDYVYSRNALDHAYDPVSALKQMVSVCKKLVLLAGHRNEGESAKYEGLHSWNFEPTTDGDLLIWNPEGKTSLRRVLENIAEVEASGEDWFQCTIRPT